LSLAHRHRHCGAGKNRLQALLVQSKRSSHAQNGVEHIAQHGVHVALQRMIDQLDQLRAAAKASPCTSPSKRRRPPIVAAPAPLP
jgi:hypothetical protein